VARSSWTNRRCSTAELIDCGRPIARTMPLGKLEATGAPAVKKRPPGQNIMIEPIRPAAQRPAFDFKSRHGRSRRHRLALRRVLTRGSRATAPELDLPTRAADKTAQGRGRRTRRRASAAVSGVHPSGCRNDRPDRTSTHEPRRGSPACRNGYRQETRTPGKRWNTGRPFLR
jgi:hypothetical protein